ncbi:MAG: AraC family transcriptional regulator, partial [Cyanobacteria bacterium P01_A01_bin.17]
MAITLTNADFQDLYEQAKDRGEQVHQPIESGVQHNLPEQLGQGGDRILQLRQGLEICIRQGQLRQPIRHVREHESNFPLVAKFYLSGTSRVQTSDALDISRDYREVSDCHYLYHLPNHTEVEEWPAEQPIHVLMIVVDPSYFGTFNLGIRGLPTPLQLLLEGDRTQRFHQPLGQISRPIQHQIQQILHCPYTGLMQQLYLESKALELLTTQFSVWQDEQPGATSVFLCSQDIEQLQQAKDILVKRAKQPPSLMDLARQVGLNDRKLNQGFRQLFGTTVFGYLQRHRMQQAQSLLHDSDLSIAKGAATVGYRSP